MAKDEENVKKTIRRIREQKAEEIPFVDISSSNDDNDLPFQIPEESKTVSIPIEESKSKEETVKLKLSDDDNLEDFIKESTKNYDKKKDEVSSGEDTITGKSENQIKEEIKKTETSVLNVEQVDDISKMIIDFFEVAMSSILSAIAYDNSSSYEISIKSKAKLSYQLALILVKHQSKMKIEYIFLFTVIAIYFNPTKKAISRRIQLNNAKKLRNNGKNSEADSIENELKKSKGRPPLS